MCGHIYYINVSVKFTNVAIYRFLAQMASYSHIARIFLALKSHN